MEVYKVVVKFRNLFKGNRCWKKILLNVDPYNVNNRRWISFSRSDHVHVILYSEQPFGSYKLFFLGITSNIHWKNTAADNNYKIWTKHNFLKELETESSRYSMVVDTRKKGMTWIKLLWLILREASSLHYPMWLKFNKNPVVLLAWGTMGHVLG